MRPPESSGTATSRLQYFYPLNETLANALMKPTFPTVSMRLSLPLTRVLSASGNLEQGFGSERLLRQGSQRPLNEFPGAGLADVGGLAPHPGLIRSTLNNWYHSTEFSIGNPPVSFNAILDLGSSTLIVPSTNTPAISPPFRHLYNSSSSSSYVANGTQVPSTPIGFRNYFGNKSGFLSQDDLQFAGLTVNQLFVEATSHQYRHCLFCEAFDTVLPLGPYNASYPLNFMSPVAQLVERNLLDDNIFSLRLSRGITDTDGQLVLGGIVDEDLYDGKFITIRLTNQTHDPGSDDRIVAGDNNWKVFAESLTFENGSGISLDFKSPTIAELDAAYPWIVLPQSLGESLNDFMEAEYWGPMAWVNCSKRSTFPHVTIVLAGQKFVLSPFDYIIEQEFREEPGRLYCQSAFVGAFGDDFGVIQLGHAFLRAFITIWDLGGKTVSFATAKNTDNMP